MVCGLSAQALLSSASSFVARIHPSDQLDFHAAMQASALHGEPWNWEGRIITEGEIKWINIRAVITQSGASLTQWDGIMLNISHARRREAELRDMAVQMEHAREQERAQFAQELQNSLVPLLDALSQGLNDSACGDAAQRAQLQRLAQAATDAARHAAMQLRPPALDTGLTEALRWLAETFSQRHDIPVTHALDQADSLSDMTTVQLFRLAQQAFALIAERKPVRAVHLSLSKSPGLIGLDIVDDGRGTGSATRDQTLGLRNLRERARLLGGTLQTIYAPGQGTAIRLRVPC
jgi:signal transduction histidine kinase